MTTPTILYLINLALVFLIGLLAFYLFPRALQPFRPLLIFLICLPLFEIFISLTNPESFVSNATSKSHYLIEALLICWLAKSLDLFFRRPAIYLIVPIGLTMCWLIEQFVTGNVSGPLSWCRILVSIVIVWLAVQILNRAIEESAASTNRYPLILVSGALIFHYVLAGVMETVLLVVDTPSQEMLVLIFYAGIFVTILTNCLYLYLILWIPRKSKSLSS